MNYYLWVLKMKKQLINKCAELNDGINTGFAACASPRHSRALASRFGSRGERRESRGERRGERRVNGLRHSRECVNLALQL